MTAGANPRIRILHVVHAMGFGGMEGRIRRLAQGLSRDAFQVDVLSLRPGEGAAQPLPEGCRHFAYEIPPGLHPLRLLGLARFIRAGGYDFVHTHNWSSMFYGMLAGRLALRPRLVHGEHGLKFEDVGAVHRKRLLAQRALAAMAHRLVPVNPVIAAHIAEAWGVRGDKVRVIVNGVDLARFPAPAAYPAGPADKLVVGTVARLDKVKNLETLLAAFARAAAARPPGTSELILVGDGPERGPLAAKARALGVEAMVRFAGESANVTEWYGRFTVYVNCSVYEGMSNTLLEAMASGLPVAASRVPGNAAWLADGEDALLFDPLDADALAAALLRLAGNADLRARMGRGNRERAEREFDNAGFLRAYEELYRGMAVKKAGKG